jgi:two-component system cell cycle response regulator DivK
MDTKCGTRLRLSLSGAAVAFHLCMPPLCLVVDDDRDNREGYAEYLQTQGFDALEAASGPEALDLIRARRPDVILLDLQIPGLDGWQVIEHVRADAETRDLPIIAVSACVFPADRQRAEDAGCTAFLAKPCIPSDVVTEIWRVLGDPCSTRDRVTVTRSVTEN